MPKTDWTNKNRTPKHWFIQHRLRINDFMIRVKDSIRKRDNLELIDFDEILERAPAATRKRKNPRGWSILMPESQENKPRGVFPDEIFGLRFLDEPEGRNLAFFFVEVDRATMPVKRHSDVTQTHFSGKLPRYYRSWQRWRADKTNTPYGFTNFLVVTLTTTQARVLNCVDAAKEAAGDGKGLGLFLFSNFNAVDSTNDVLEMPWINGRGRNVTLLD